MTLFFVPLASLVLGRCRPSLEGVASGANSAFRELGGVLGIAALGAVFSANGGYASGTQFVAGLTPAVEVGAAVVAVGALCRAVHPGPAPGPPCGRFTGAGGGRGRSGVMGSSSSNRSGFPPDALASSSPSGSESALRVAGCAGECRRGGRRSPVAVAPRAVGSGAP